MPLIQNTPAVLLTAAPISVRSSVSKPQAATLSTLASSSLPGASNQEPVAIGCCLGIYAARQYNKRPQVQPLKAFENELGVQAPLGFWDPAGYTVDGDQALFNRRRETELKHGRVAMLATLGYIVPEYTRFPGFLSPSKGLDFASVPNGLVALKEVPGSGWLQIFLFLGLMETAWIPMDPSRAPGDRQRCGVLGVPNGAGNMKDNDLRQKKLSAELANGRLAMMAIIGMFFQDGLTGSAWGDWANYTASPLRAFENELGVQAPVGFWDPVGYTADGNLENFARRRQTELKHGRIAMLATIGYITPEITGKFSGFLSPSKGLRFEDIPNGLAAVSKVPAGGWAQIIAYCSYCEVSQDQSPGTPASKGQFGFTVLTSSDPAEKQKKLSAELANGRLAMMAIIGMFFQDGLTGSAWGDWQAYTDSPLRAFENELGVQAPLGFWDPAGLSKSGDVEEFQRRRETEIKHGRISMIACIGYITPEYFRWPGLLAPRSDLTFDDVPNGLAALGKVPGAGWAQIVIFCGWRELTWGFEAYKQGKRPGDYDWKMITSGDDNVRSRKLSAELANGRLAMMAIIGMFFQDGLTGSAWGDWANYTDSPLRAFEGELGVQAPVGFFDPAGLSKTGDEEEFKRRRATELKHGRVSMLACIGYIVPEYAKWPGFLAPKEGILFTDVPNGLKAFSTVPGLGWLQIFIFAFFIEKALFVADDTRPPGDFKNAGVLGVPNASSLKDPEVKKKKLNAELANGRLAMLAVIGMFFQDGLTGSAWGDWALYTASPLRADETEYLGSPRPDWGKPFGEGPFDPAKQVGALPPLGYWDPAGFTKDEESFRQYRAAEIKHARVAMTALVGLTFAHDNKFGWIPESAGAGVNAFQTPEAGQGLAVLVLIAGFFELKLWTEDISRAPGNFEDPAGWTLSFNINYDEELRNKELNNGRFAMIAVIGSLVAEQATGLDAVEQINYTISRWGTMGGFENF